MKIVFDTSAWVEYVLGTDKGKKVAELLDSEEILTPDVGLIEISCKSANNGWDFEKIFNFILFKSSIAKFDYSEIEKIGKLYVETKKENKNIGLIDIIILSIARQENAKLLTTDSDLKKFDESISL